MSLTLIKPNFKKILSYIIVFIIITSSILTLFIQLDNSYGENSNQTRLGSEFSEPNNHSFHTDSQASRAVRSVKYWATFQFDYWNRGYTTGRAPSTNNLIWKFNDNGKLQGEIFSSPIVVNEFVYFTSDKMLYAVDRKFGEIRWKYDLEHVSYATPTVANGYVYVGTGSETQIIENKLYRINAYTGERDMRFNINFPDGGVIGAPIILKPQGETYEKIYFGSLKENRVYCYDIINGEAHLDWEYQLPHPGTKGNDGIWSTLAYYHTNQTLEPYLIFTTNCEDINPDPPSPGFSRGIYCLLARTGIPVWNFPGNFGEYPDLQTYSSPAIFFDPFTNKSNVLFGGGTPGAVTKGHLFCLDIETGTLLWNFSTGGGSFGYGITTSPVIAYDKIFFGACDGKFYALDFKGKLIWKFKTNNSDDGIYSSPAVADNKVFFGSTDKTFYCLDVNNGSLIWKYDTGLDSLEGTYGVSSAPSIAYDRIYVGCSNGFLYCFGDKGSEPPSIQIDYPQNNTIVSGVIEIAGEAEDDFEVRAVQVRIDDGPWENTTTPLHWFHLWDTTTVPDGPHTIYAQAWDGINFAFANVTVIVNNGGYDILLNVTSHEDGQIISGITRFVGTAYHTSGIIQEVQINIDNSTWEPVNGTTNWYYYWDTREYEDGQYLIQFRAFDGIINSSPINLTLNVSNYIEPIEVGIYPMFRANLNRTGISSNKVPRSAEVIWKFETENQVESSPIFFNNKIYFGSDDYFIYCLDSKFGTEQWRYETANQVRSTPVIANNKLYIGSQDFHLYCLNAISGEFIWKYRTSGGIDSSPLIVDDHIFFGSYDGNLYALNASDGKEIWIFKLGGEIWGSPAYSEIEECLYIGSLDGKFHSVWLRNGTERWNFTTNQQEQFYGIYSTPAVAGDKVIFGSEDKIVYCLNSSTGEPVWQFRTTGKIYSSAAVNKNKVFISSLEEKNDGVLYALPLDDPYPDGVITSTEIIWKFKVHEYDGGSSPMVSNTSGKVVVGSNEGSSGGVGKVYCVDEETGEEFWNFTTGGDLHSSPIIVLNRVYIGSLDGYMYCIGDKISPEEMPQIFINVSLPINRVLAGHAIENITFTAHTNDTAPIPQAWFTFSVTAGYLSDYYGTAFEDGSYSLSFIAPEPKKVKNNITITISVNASRFGYKNGSLSIDIVVEPRSSSITNGDKENGEPKDNDEEPQDDLIKEISKPENLNLVYFILILLILNIIIIGLLIRMKHKLNRLERSPEAGEADSEKLKSGELKKITTGSKASPSSKPKPSLASEEVKQPTKFIPEAKPVSTTKTQPTKLSQLIDQVKASQSTQPSDSSTPKVIDPTPTKAVSSKSPEDTSSDQPVVNDPTMAIKSDQSE